jgi:hypothetical protein
VNEHQRWFWRSDAFDRFLNSHGSLPVTDAVMDARERQLGPMGLARAEFMSSIRSQQLREEMPSWMREIVERHHAEYRERGAGT